MMTSPAFAVSDLNVSGITGTYVSANGKCTFQSVDGNGYNIWIHESGNFYIYEYWDSLNPWWMIDTDTDGNNDFLFYECGSGGLSTLDAATFTPTANLFGTNAGTIAFVSNDGSAMQNYTITVPAMTGIFKETTFTSPHGIFHFNRDSHRTTFGQNLWEITSDENGYKKQKIAFFDNLLSNTIGWMNVEEQIVGGWYNAYLCQ